MVLRVGLREERSRTGGSPRGCPGARRANCSSQKLLDRRNIATSTMQRSPILQRLRELNSQADRSRKPACLRGPRRSQGLARENRQAKVRRFFHFLASR